MLRSIYLLSFFLLQSLFAFAGNVKEDVPSTFDLYVCIGQSNMAGRATLTPEVMDTLQNVYLLNDKGNFEPAVNPLNRYSTVRKDLSMQRLGPAYGFAKEMTRKTKRPLGLVVNARGGSSINSWLKGSKDGYYEEEAPCLAANRGYSCKNTHGCYSRGDPLNCPSEPEQQYTDCLLYTSPSPRDCS